jgi:uncharacterized protein YuzE
MKITYDPEADVLCLILRDDPPVDAVEEPEGVIVSYGADEEPVSIEFMDAAARNLTPADEVHVTVQAKARRSLPH